MCLSTQFWLWRRRCHCVCFCNSSISFNNSVEENRNITTDESIAVSAGGAIWYFVARTLRLNWHIRNSTFANNTAYTGGAVNIIYTSSSMTSRFTNCDFRGNRARGGGGAITALGGLIEIFGTKFYGNNALYAGGVLVAPGTRLTVGPSPNLKQRTTFIRNEASVGGGIYTITEGKLKYRVCVTLFITLLETGNFTDAEFVENVAYDQGGAIAAYGNRDTISFAGGRFERNRAVAGGAIAFITGGNLTVVSYHGKPTRFTRNVALVGGALYFREGHTILGCSIQKERGTQLRRSKST